ncbi:MAG TPA: S8 family serine peptidase [Allosphingosinicella sp.]|nr:S8 family serine peptidase [Allosphingosinicella sp.]
MARIPVIVEFAAEPRIATAEAMFAMEISATEDLPTLAGLDLDPSFAPVAIPKLYDVQAFGLEATMGVMEAEVGQVPVADSYIVRGDVEEEEAEALASREGVVGVFADVSVEPMLICPFSPPLGTDADVERLLCTARLRSVGADGRSVLVAIVDTGINMAYLNSRGKNPAFDAARSWTPGPGITPGSMPVGHGTMCAYDVCIAAPACTLLDVPFLAVGGRLSDAIRAYNHLVQLMRAPRRPGESRSLVVNNSWGMTPGAPDFPIGHPSNYSNNPLHPFNVLVGTLEGLGADILFAAGNCGAPCPSGNCGGVTANTIIGANGHDKVLCVAGVDVTKQRVGYSSQGPGRLTRNKPDLCGYTHFAGSGVYAADGGTSAATPVVAGLVAAWRSRNHFQPGNPSLSPEALRNMLRATCQDLGGAGFDFDHGFGVVQGCKLADQWIRPDGPRLCDLIPDLCGPWRISYDICRRYPEICELVVPWPIKPGQPIPKPGEDIIFDLGAKGERLDSLTREQLGQLLFVLGQVRACGEARVSTTPTGEMAGAAKCGCA